MAALVEDETTRVKFSAVFDKAKVAFNEKLWNGIKLNFRFSTFIYGFNLFQYFICWLGSYYDFDSGGDFSSKSIMADQLCGIWYLQSCGVTDEVCSDGFKLLFFTFF